MIVIKYICTKATFIFITNNSPIYKYKGWPGREGGDVTSLVNFLV